MLRPVQNIIIPHSSSNIKTIPDRSFSRTLATLTFGYSSPLKDIAKHCAYCGCEMLTESELNQTLSKLADYSNVKLQNEIIKVMKLLPDKPSAKLRRDILQEMLDFSCKKPDLTGQQILRKILFNKEVAFEDEIELSRKQKAKIFAELKTMQPKLPQYTQDLINDLLKLNPALEITVLKGVYLIKKKSLKEGLTLPDDFISYADKAYEKFQELKKSKTINDTRLHSPREFLNRILAPLKVTMEHVHPHSKDGDDDTSNYLAVCSSCNTERANIPFTDHLQKHPEAVRWIIKSLEEIKKVISRMTNPPSELKTYIPEITHTLRVESKGQIDLVA